MMERLSLVECRQKTLQLVAEAVSQIEVTPEAVVEKGAELAVQFEKMGKNAQEDYVEIPCSHCGESLYVRRSDLEKRFKK